MQCFQVFVTNHVIQKNLSTSNENEDAVSLAEIQL